MKRILILILAALMLLACTSCKGMKDETNATEINHFTPLENNMTLYVGANGVFTN